MEATVLIPTFDHGPLIRHALASAQGQSVRDLEIFVVGDGAPAITREIVERAAVDDPRVRYFENPKGERPGERHRRWARRRGASSAISATTICGSPIMSRRWPNSWSRRISPAGFRDGSIRTGGSMRKPAISPCANIATRGSSSAARWDSRSAPTRSRSTGGCPRAGARLRPMSTPISTCGGRSLPMPGCRAVTSFRPTGIGFSSTLRTHMSLEEREREIERWAAVIADPVRIRSLRDAILVANLKDATWDAHYYAERRGLHALAVALRQQPQLRRFFRWPRGRGGTPAAR